MNKMGNYGQEVNRMQTKIDVSTQILDWIIRSIPLETVPDKVLSSIQKWRSGDSNVK